MFFDFKNKQSGKKFKTFIVAEIGQSHNGSLKYAKNLIDHSAKAGADAVKFRLITLLRKVLIKINLGRKILN